MATIYKRGEVWYSLFKVGGRQIRQPLDLNERVARLKLKALVHKYRLDGRQSRLSWQAFKEWYFGQTTKAEWTTAREKAALASLERFRAIRRVTDVTPALLLEYKAWRLKDSKGPATVARDIRAIKVVMRCAENAMPDVPEQNWRAVPRGKVPRGKLYFLTRDQLATLLLKVRGSWLETVVRLGAFAGLRRSEVYWLKWSDVDLDRYRLHITPKEGWAPKNHQEKHVQQYVPLNKALGAYLAALPRASEWVLEPRHSPDVVTASLKKVMLRLKLPGSVHVLRHTFGSHLAMAGVSMRKIQELMRHSSIQSTEVYAHLSPESVESEVERLPNL